MGGWVDVGGGEGGLGEMGGVELITAAFSPLTDPLSAPAHVGRKRHVTSCSLSDSRTHLSHIFHEFV